MICFYYFMPDEFRNVNAPPTHDNAGDIPLDLEDSYGRSNGFGGWEGAVGSDESDDGDLAGPPSAIGLLRDTSVDLGREARGAFEAIKGVRGEAK